MASKQDRAERLAHLERLIRPPRQPGGRTMGDVFTERGFTEAEIQRAGEWLGVCLKLDAEPLTPENAQQRNADELAAMHGASWLHCRLEHGPGLCGLDCPGEFRHRPAWQPAHVEPVAPRFEPEAREPETPPETDAVWPPRQPEERQVLLRDPPRPKLRF